MNEKECPSCDNSLTDYRMQYNGYNFGLTATCKTCNLYMRVQKYWKDKNPRSKLTINKLPKVNQEYDTP